MSNLFFYKIIINSSGIFSVFNFNKKKQPKQQPVQTIDLSEEADENLQQSQAKASYSHNRKSDFKKPQAYIDLSDDDDVQLTSFSQNQILSSTVLKSNDRRKSMQPPATVKETSINQSRRSISSIPEIKPINTLQEKQANIRACDPDVINSIVRKFHESREFKDRAILEEIRKWVELKIF